MPSRVAAYIDELQQSADWLAFLRERSGLPGPRGNLELADAFAQVAPESLVRLAAALGPDEAPENTPEGYVAFCGVQALGRLAAEGKVESIAQLRRLAADPRWRVREAVARGLQILGDSDIERLVEAVHDWQDTPYERRAAIAALCEPRLLADDRYQGEIFRHLELATRLFEQADDTRTEAMKVLRKGLAYAWSVAAAAYPVHGKEAMERWLASTQRDIVWIMRQNLAKKRLSRLDADWVHRCLGQMHDVH